MFAVFNEEVGDSYPVAGKPTTPSYAPRQIRTPVNATTHAYIDKHSLIKHDK